MQAENSDTDAVLEVKAREINAGSKVIREREKRVRSPIAMVQDGALSNDVDFACLFAVSDPKGNPFDSGRRGLSFLIQMNQPGLIRDRTGLTGVLQSAGLKQRAVFSAIVLRHDKVDAVKVIHLGRDLELATVRDDLNDIREERSAGHFILTALNRPQQNLRIYTS